MNKTDLKNILIKRVERIDSYTIECSGTIISYNIEDTFVCQIIEGYKDWWINPISFNLDSEKKIFKVLFLQDLKIVLKNNPKIPKTLLSILKGLLLK